MFVALVCYLDPHPLVLCPSIRPYYSTYSTILYSTYSTYAFTLLIAAFIRGLPTFVACKILRDRLIFCYLSLQVMQAGADM